MKEQRKRIWIDPFQTGLLTRIAAYLLICQLVIWGFYAFCDQINRVLDAMGVEGPFLTSALGRTLLAFLILVPPLAVDTIRFAHRLVGPLYRFRKTMQAIAAGEPVALVRLRRGDQLVDFQDDFNAMLRALEAKGMILVKAAGQRADAASLETIS
jgi:hypothetical protein